MFSHGNVCKKPPTSSIHLQKNSRLRVTSILNDSPGSFRLFLLLQKQEAFTTKSTVTCLKRQPGLCTGLCGKQAKEAQACISAQGQSADV